MENSVILSMSYMPAGQVRIAIKSSHADRTQCYLYGQSDAPKPCPMGASDKKGIECQKVRIPHKGGSPV